MKQQKFMGGSRTAPTIFVIILFCLAACAPIVPAQTPPQLEFTPGAPVTIDDTLYDAGVFRMAYPQGWRVVKSNTAEAPMSAVFVSPDETMAIHVTVDPQGEFTIPGDHTERKTRRIDLASGESIAIGASATFESWDTLVPIYEGIVDSLSS